MMPENPLEDRWWRLSNLYWITDKLGNVVRFRPNWAQTLLHNNLWYRNDVLKVRQLGISTYAAMLMLDMCLFEPNKAGGIIDKSLPDATGKLRKIKFAYEHLGYVPAEATEEELRVAKLGTMIRGEVPANVSQTSMSFGNGSRIDVGTSLRGGTFQLLHISELAHVAAHAPIRAREIVTGSINAVGMGGVVIKESTHEGGKWGLNYEMTRKAMDMVGRKLSPLDFKFFFFSWIQHEQYRLPDAEPPDDPELCKYFDELKVQHGIELDDEQKAWYASQARTYGAAVRQEYPTVPEEAFQTQVEGAIYGSWITRLRSQGRLNAEFEVDDLAPLYVSWDIGMADYMSLWLFQVRGDGKFYVVDNITCHNKALEWYVGRVRQWEADYGVIAKHLLPHDASRRDWEGVSFESKLRQAGFTVSVVPRTTSVWAGIFAVRRLLAHCVFHERCSRSHEIDGEEFMSGVNALENYQEAPPGRNGSLVKEPLHNRCSHAADGFRTFAEASEAGLVGRLPAAIKGAGGEKRGFFGLVRGAEDMFDI